MREPASRVRMPQQERSAKKKQAIVDSAQHLFSSRGYHGTSAKEIAHFAGVSTGTFYAYFEDKRAAFMAVLTLYLDAFAIVVRGVMEGAGAKGDADTAMLLRQLVEGLLQAHDLMGGLHDEVIAMQISDRDVAALVAEKRAAMREAAVHYMLEWQGRLAVTDPEAAAVVVFDSIDAVIDSIVLSRTTVPRDRLLSSLIEMLTRYLA